MTDTNTKETNYEKINEYFKLKSKYETQFDKEKKKLLNAPNLSWKEKRKLFKEFKPKCIVCKRPVGNIFNIIKENDKDNRKFSAICGDLVSPCGFKYIVNVEDCNTYTENIDIFEKELSDLKNQVINYKNKQLFGYVSNEEVVEIFDNLKETITDSSTILEYFLNAYTNIVDNKTTNENISKLKMDIYNTYINNIKISMNEFNKTNNVQFVRDAVDIYVNILTPKLKELTKLQYSKSFVEYNSDTNTYNLIQKKTDIGDIEYNYSVEVLEENLTGNLDKVKKKSKEPKEPKGKKPAEKKAPALFILEDSSD